MGMEPQRLQRLLLLQRRLALLLRLKLQRQQLLPTRPWQKQHHQQQQQHHQQQQHLWLTLSRRGDLVQQPFWRLSLKTACCLRLHSPHMLL